MPAPQPSREPMPRLGLKLPGQRGRAAEERACRYLEARGLQLVARNYRSRWGEIDLIMRDRTELVFVEVRQRSSRRFGGALESVDGRKQRRLLATAERYLQQQPHQPPARFDVLALGAPEDPVEWVRDAFGSA
jgi:putative endonuclease